MVTLKICLLKEGEICFAVTLNDMYLSTQVRKLSEIK